MASTCEGARTPEGETEMFLVSEPLSFRNTPLVFGLGVLMNLMLVALLKSKGTPVLGKTVTLSKVMLSQRKPLTPASARNMAFWMVTLRTLSLGVPPSRSASLAPSQ